MASDGSRRWARDLRRHAQDFAQRCGFTYTVVETGSDRVIGRVYIYPSRDQPV